MSKEGTMSPMLKQMEKMGMEIPEGYRFVGYPVGYKMCRFLERDTKIWMQSLGLSPMEAGIRTEKFLKVASQCVITRENPYVFKVLMTKITDNQ